MTEFYDSPRYGELFIKTLKIPWEHLSCLSTRKHQQRSQTGAYVQRSQMWGSLNKDFSLNPIHSSTPHSPSLTPTPISILGRSLHNQLEEVSNPSKETMTMNPGEMRGRPLMCPPPNFSNPGLNSSYKECLWHLFMQSA